MLCKLNFIAYVWENALFNSIGSYSALGDTRHYQDTIHMEKQYNIIFLWSDEKNLGGHQGPLAPCFLPLYMLLVVTSIRVKSHLQYCI